MTFFTVLFLALSVSLAAFLVLRGVIRHDSKLDAAHKNVVPFTGYFNRDAEWGD